MPRDSNQHAYSRHFVFGLRPSLLLALALTSVVTLSVAALALLPPLKSRLYSDALSQTESAVDLAKPGLEGIPLAGRHPRPRELRTQALAVKGHFKAERVIILSTSLRALADTDPDEPVLLARSVAASSLRAKDTSKPQHVVHDGLLVVASLYDDHNVRAVLEIFTRLDYVQQATDVVSDAFLEAAAAGLAVALLLGAALSGRLVRRLRRLRDATSGFERGGFDERDLTNLIVPDDRARDEIGELARAFASMRTRLLQQEQARRAFVATASHELRTPLTSLDGMLELLADDLGGEQLDIEDARTRVAMAQQQSHRHDRRRRPALLGRGRSRQRRADRAHPARQCAANRAGALRRGDRRCQRRRASHAGCLGPGTRGAGGGARAHIRALSPRHAA